jgi:hypothetical protein
MDAQGSKRRGSGFGRALRDGNACVRYFVII